MPNSRSTVDAVEVLAGHELSRRTFLKAASLAGVAAATATSGLARSVRAQAQVEPQSLPEPPVITASDVAARLGNDPETIFRFVTEHVRYEPYPGQLRGARGVFANRAGNSVDQAEFLATLLQAAGVATRYAFGTLDEAAAARLSASSVSAPPTIAEETLAALTGVLPDEPPPHAAITAEQQARIDQAIDDAAAVNTWAKDQVSSSLDTITAALAGVGQELPMDFSQVPELEVQQHTWVQAQLGGEWVDLDPTIPGAIMGSVLTDAISTADELPDELFHYVDIAIEAETSDGSALSRAELISLTGKASEWSGKPLMYFVVDEEAMPLAASALSVVTGTRTYFPILAVGDRSFRGEAMQFGSDGDDGDDGGLGGGFFDSGPAAEETTAAWITTTLRGPGREPSTSERSLFDRFGADARAAGELDPAVLPAAEIVDLGGDAGEQVLPVQSYAWLSVATGLPGQTSDVGRLAADDPMVPTAIAHAHLLLDDIAGKQLLPTLGVRTFADGPNISAFTGRYMMDADSSPYLEGALDIWHRSRGTVPVDGVEPAGSPAAMAGITSHMSERLLLGDATRSRASDPVPGAVSVGRVFELASESAIPVRSLTTPSDVEAGAYDAVASARLASRLEQGWVAVAPTAPVAIDDTDRIGWWLVDPETGRVIDEMDDGRGSFVEDLVVRAKEIATAMATKCLGLTLLTAFAFLATVLILYLAAYLSAEGATSLSVFESFLSIISGNTMWDVGKLLIECAV